MPTVNTIGSRCTILSDSGYFIKVDARDTAIIYLSEEFAEVGAAMCHTHAPGTDGIDSRPLKIRMEIYIPRRSAFWRILQAPDTVSADAHVERTGIEFVQFLLPPRIPPVVKNAVME